MKTLVWFLVALSGIAFAHTSTEAESLPEGLAASDWSEIHAAYEAGRHAPHRQENGHLVARNPGQQWLAEFDGKGISVRPDQGDWTWGLELTGYGDRTLPSAASPSQLRHDEGKIICQRDENLSEWFINDSRGLEQGWDIRERPTRADSNAPLQLHLSIRGTVQPQVSAAGDRVSFQQESGVSALNYGGLKAWDADGKKLAVRFEQADEKSIRIMVEDQGARYPITIDPVAQQAHLTASNPGLNDFFGCSIGVSGNTVVVGAMYEDSDAQGVNGNQANNSAFSSGAAYVFVRNATGWKQQAYLKASNSEDGDLFGRSVAISGNTIVVGANEEDSAARGVNGNQDDGAFGSGAAYVFVRNGTVWTQQAYLKSSNSDGLLQQDGGDSFGFSVAISGDTLVVGAPFEASNATGVNGNQSNNGYAYSGAAYVFKRNGSGWGQQAYLKASNTGVFDRFGSAVGISGDTLIVGAPRQSGNATGVNGNQTSSGADSSGAAYVFTRSGSAWSQQAYLKASNANTADLFASSVAVSGDTVVVGAINEDSAATGINGDQANNSATDSGAAYVFTRSGTAWSQQHYLKASNTGVDDCFGSAVAISGDLMAIGAHQPVSILPAGGLVYEPGAAYLIHLNVLPLEILIEQESASLASGATKEFGLVAMGGASEVVFHVVNAGESPLTLTGTPKVAVSGDSDFSVLIQPSSPLASGGYTAFKVRFAPTSGGTKSASLTIPSNPSNDGSSTPFVIHLGGTGLSYTTDTDGDGLGDASEFTMAALGFNWQLSQTDLVNAYLSSLNGPGLYTPAQLEAQHPGKVLLPRDPVSNRFKLTARWQKSTSLVDADFFDFPAPADSAVSISPSGKIEFEFSSPEKSAFFRLKED